MLATLTLPQAASRHARADDASKSVAQAQLEAQTLMAEGRYKEACTRLEVSDETIASPLTRWSLPGCWEKAGRRTRAWQLYRELAAAPGVTADEARLATERAAAIEPHLGRVALALPEPGPEGLSLSLDGEPLARESWSHELRVELGRHQLSAVAPGHRRWERVVQVAAGRLPIRIDVPRLEVATGEGPPAAALTPQGPGELDAPNDLTAPAAPSYTPALVAGGIGVAGLTVGVIAGLLAASKNSEARKLCARQTEGCPPAQKDDRDALKRYVHRAHQVSDIGIGVGALGLVAGGVLYFVTKGKEAEPGPGVRVAPSLGMDQVGVSVSGNF